MNKNKISKIQILIPLVILLSSCVKNNYQTIFGVKADVYSFVEYHYLADKQEKNWEARQYLGCNKVFFLKQFDKTKNEIVEPDKRIIIKQYYFDRDSTLRSTVKYTYRSNKELEYLSFDKNDKKTSEGIFLTEEGEIIKKTSKIFYSKHKIATFTCFYEYSENGLIVSEKMKNLNGEVTNSYKYKYLDFDSKGNWTIKLKFDAKNCDFPEIIIFRKYQYSKNK